MARLKFGPSSLLGRIVFGPATVAEIINIIASPATGSLVAEGRVPRATGEYLAPTIAGIIYDPLGSPIVGSILRFVALDSIGYSIEGSIAEYTTDLNGAYSFKLAFGKYRIEAKYDDEYHDLGIVIVDRTIPPVVSVTDLILYGSPVTPPILVDVAPDWALLFSEVQSQGEHREAQYQIREGTDYTSETKELWVASDAAMTDESLESNTRSTKMTSQIRTYEDDVLNQAALLTNEGTTNNLRTYTSLEALEGADGSQELSTSEVLTGTNSKIADSRKVSASGLEIAKEVTFENTSIQEIVVADGFSLDQTTVTTVGGSTVERTNGYAPSHVDNAVTIPQPKAVQEDNSSLVELIGGVTHTASINNHQEMVISVDELASALRRAGVKVYNKEAYQELSIEGGVSTLITQVDEHLIQDDAGNVLAEFDTINNKLTLNGRLEIENAEDFQGPTGDSVDYLYQYSADNGVTDAWHDVYDAEHPDRWRRQHKTINGVTVGSWEVGVYLNAKDGRDGDTYFNQFQYSTNDTSRALDSWHLTYISGDDWRRWRVIENGLPVGVGHEFYGPESGWYEERMKGLDGPAGWVPDVQYQYSVDNLPPWHSDFITGDIYRRERVNWYASNDDFLNKDHPTSPSTPILAGTWTSGAKIAPEAGVDYGDKTATVIMYQRLNGDTPPADPSNIIYTFDTVTIDPQDNVAWTPNIPEGLEDIWVAIGTAFGRGTTDTVDDWVVEKQVANGFKTGVAWLYRVTDQNTILNATHLPTNALTYTFATGKVSGSLNNGWSATIPDSLTSEGSKTWITHNTAVSPVANLVDTLDADDWEDPSVLVRNGLDGVDGDSGGYTSFVFFNRGTAPATPVNGSFDGSTEVLPDDTASGTKWTDDPTTPSAGETVWMAKAKYSYNGTSWDNLGWSTPLQFSGADGEDGTQGDHGSFDSFIFRNSETTPSTPTGGSFNGVTETYPTNWVDSPSTPTHPAVTWMSKTTYSFANDVWTATPVWSAPAQFSGSKGDTGEVGDAGEFTSFVYRNANTKPLTPLNGSFGVGGEVFPHVPSDVNDKWSDDPVDPPAGQTTWMSTTKYNVENDVWSNSLWSSPTRFSGLAGVNAGRYVSNVYKNASSVPTGAALATGGSFADGVETLPSTGWFDASQPLAANEFTWISTAVYLYNAGTGLWSNSGWSAPVQFSGAAGSDGDKGTFIAYAFKNSATAISVRPTGGSYIGLGPRMAPDFDWELEPSSPVFGSRTWVSSTTYTWDDPSNTWGAGTWSIPALFSGERGVDAGKFTSHMYAAAVSAPTSITGGSFTGDPSTEVPPTSSGGTWYDNLPTPAAGQLSWMITAVYIYNDTNNTWSHSGWSTPVRLTGEQGSSGVDGNGWYYINYISYLWFNNQDTFNFLEYGDDLVGVFTTAFGHAPVNGDILTIAAAGNSYTDTGIYVEVVNRFDVISARVEGNMLIHGTLNANRIKTNTIYADLIQADAITGDKINSATTIIAGSGGTSAGMNGDDDNIDGLNPYANYRFWAGDDYPSSAPFSVDKEGQIKIQSNTSGTGMTINNDSLTVTVSGVPRVVLGKLS